ncbi:YkgJ family cysteine cluster protein [Thermodesulfobacteriota bacterium]
MPSELPVPEDIFSCKQCGDCCRGYGGTVVTRQDIESIATFLKTTPDHFVKAYCSKSGKNFVISQGGNGYCIFWDKNCTIHRVKPRMCKLWPYIHSVLIDVENWQIMAAGCPGMRTDIPDKTVRACVKRVLDKKTLADTF